MTLMAHRPTTPLDRLAPIGLVELIDEAALLARVDRKYVLAAKDLPALLSRAPDSTRVLEIDGSRSFGYRSTYLDTPDLASFHQAGRGQRRRFKVRTRAYATGSCWLEVKTRSGRDVTVKERIAHLDAEDHPLSLEGRAFVDDSLRAAGVRGTRAEDLRPTLVTAYSRSTLFLPESSSRVTIDTDLGWTGLTGRRRDLDRPALAIVETKTGSTPSAFDRLLWACGHRPVRISKYGAGLAALRPDLPRLKWHRALERHLTCPRPTHTEGLRP